MEVGQIRKVLDGMLNSPTMWTEETHNALFYASQELSHYERILDKISPDKIGEFSDGYHTFDDLYHQRAVLFAVICNQNKEKAWKSKKHSDGSMFGDDWFIVGINTDQGQYTYHYQMHYWPLFGVKELEFAPEWDGHTDKDVGRLFSI